MGTATELGPAWLRLSPSWAIATDAGTAAQGLAGEAAGRQTVTHDELIGALEADLRSLLKGEYSSLIIAFNDDHARNYETAAEWRDYRDPDDRIDWVSDEERDKAIAENSVWTCQWYPNTPIGFCCIGASSLSALIAALRARGGSHG